MFTEKLLTWYAENQRTLPWRGERDPYRIWVSEIILQQTRVQQGWDYYLRFIERFPTVSALADAPEEEVLKVWQGLGYYSRARNMHAAAQQVARRHDGRFPQHYEELRQLKGVGDYTAAAIASIAFGLPYPAVDGNVLRVFSRIFGIYDDIAANTTRKQITTLCQQHLDEQDPGRFNQACMEFGAIQCVPRSPKCDTCPFALECYAHTHNATDILPIKKRLSNKRERYLHFIVYTYKNQILVEKRTGNDIWKNLYQFPLTETNTNRPLADREVVAELREVLTHQILRARFYIEATSRKIKAKANQQWVDMAQLHQLPMPKIMTQFIERL